MGAARIPLVLLAAAMLACCGSAATEPSAPAAPPGLESFSEFRYRAMPGLGFCLRPGDIETATIWSQEGRMSLDWSARGGARGGRILTDWDADDVRELFAGLAATPEAAEADAGNGEADAEPNVVHDGSVTTFDFADDVVESDDRCVIDEFEWLGPNGRSIAPAGLAVGDADAARILDLLESLRAASE